MTEHAQLPAGGTPYRIAIVCLGNICRSPMAHVVLESALAEVGLAEAVTITSSGTAGWHTGKPMDSRAAAELSAAGHDPSRHRARQFTPAWFDHDLILAMDASNLADILALAPTAIDPGRVRLFRDFDPLAETGAEVPDPWSGGRQGFTDVLAMVERTAAHLVTLLQR